MAEAILSSLHKVQNMKNVYVYDIHKGRCTYMHETYGISVSNTIDECIQDAEVILLAVKPQNVVDVAAMVVDPPSGMLLSIVAGCTIQHLREQFKTNVIMRTMPNTPAMISEGITVWTATAETPDELRRKGEGIMSCIGESVQVQEEKYLDMATAISGSGPAYVLLTMEAMIDAGVHLGFPRDVAIKLVLNTLRGSTGLALESNKSVEELKHMVTSPSGTTAAALYELESGGFRTVVANAIWAGYRKALELGGQNSNVGPGRSR